MVFKLGEVVYYAVQLTRTSWEFRRAVVVGEDKEEAEFLLVHTGKESSWIRKEGAYRHLQNA